MQNQQSSGEHELLAQALQLLRSALELLDRAEAPAQVGAYVDYAIHQLHEEFEKQVAPNRFDQLGRNAEPQ